MLLEACPGLIVLALKLVHLREVVPRFDELGMQPHGLLELQLRTEQVAALQQHDTQFVVRLGMVGRQLDGLLERIDGLVEPSQFMADSPQVAMKNGVRRIERDGAADAVGGLCRSSRPMCDQAQMVPGRCMLRINPQKLLVETFRLLEFAGLLQRHRAGECIPLTAHWNPFQMHLELSLSGGSGAAGSGHYKRFSKVCPCRN
jgi:hypothetical protein